MAKIKMTTPIVEMDGDEMTRILWKMIKNHLLEPFIEMKLMTRLQSILHLQQRNIKLL